MRAEPSWRRFAEFDLANPQVWLFFQRFTFEMIGRGFSNYSAYAVMQRVRWETASVERGKNTRKIPNCWSPFYARKFRNLHPAKAGIFQYRASCADMDQAA